MSAINNSLADLALSMKRMATDMNQVLDKSFVAAAPLPMQGNAVDATEYTRSLERLAARFARHRLCMSYNDSYFGEPAGELKRIAAELYRLLPSEAFDEKTPAHKAACALTGEAEACPCQKATNALGVDAMSEIRDRRSSQRDHRMHERIQQTLDSQNSTGTDPKENAD